MPRIFEQRPGVPVGISGLGIVAGIALKGAAAFIKFANTSPIRADPDLVLKILYNTGYIVIA